MKNIMLLLTVMVLAACGDEDAGHGPAGALEFHVTPDAADVQATVVAPPFFQEISREIPESPPPSEHFDAEGHIIGIYAVPYVPKSAAATGGNP